MKLVNIKKMLGVASRFFLVEAFFRRAWRKTYPERVTKKCIKQKWTKKQTGHPQQNHRKHKRATWCRLLPPQCWPPCTPPPKRPTFHVFLNFSIDGCASRKIHFFKSKEGTRAVILHSVLAPVNTCSTCGARLKFEIWQLGFQGFESQPAAL